MLCVTFATGLVRKSLNLTLNVSHLISTVNFIDLDKDRLFHTL